MFEMPDGWYESVKSGHFPQNSILVRTIIPLLGNMIRFSTLRDHGIDHTRRVCLYAEILSWEYGAECFPAVLAAFCHDAGRTMDGREPDHGTKSWMICEEAIRSLVDKKYIGIMKRAITGHTDAQTSTDPIIASVWDADRIDLMRFGHPPVLSKLDPGRFSRPKALRLAEMLIDIDFGFARDDGFNGK
jgi:hypothetical protein